MNHLKNNKKRTCSTGCGASGRRQKMKTDILSSKFVFIHSQNRAFLQNFDYKIRFLSKSGRQRVWASNDAK